MCLRLIKDDLQQREGPQVGTFRWDSVQVSHLIPFSSPQGEPITAANLSKIFETANYYEKSFLDQCLNYSHLFIIFAASKVIM